MSDYHVHLHPHAPRRGGPAPGEDPVDFVERYVEAAASRGVDQLGFTEHLFRCVESEDVLGPFWEAAGSETIRRQTEEIVRLDRTLSIFDYVDTISRAKQRGLPVLLGLEVDFSPESYADVLEFLDGFDFDFLIGSVHWMNGWVFDRSTAVAEIETRGSRRLYEEYFAVETQLAEAGGVDVLAHVDRCKTMGLIPDHEPLDLYEPLVEATMASGLAVEVSSGGLRKAVAEIYPAPALLRLFREAGVPITLASDAHYPKHAGWGHAMVVDAARTAGYESHLRFEDQRWQVRSLPEDPPREGR